jgi:LPS sulfotransferase NodH
MYLPQKTYVICTTPRSGSHLLAEALQITGVAGKPDEYFTPNKAGKMQNEQGHVVKIYGKQSLTAFHELVLSLGSTSNGVFGIILHIGYLPVVLNAFRTLPLYAGLSDKAILDALFYEPKFIWLRRRDKVRQAISWIKAQQTGNWSMQSGTAASSQPTQLQYDYFAIEQKIENFTKDEQRWASFFRTNNIDPFTVMYTELVQSFEQTSVELLKFLDVPQPKGIKFKERKLKKQADNINELWAAKYLRQQSSSAHRVYRFFRHLKFKLLSI